MQFDAVGGAFGLGVLPGASGVGICGIGVHGSGFGCAGALEGRCGTALFVAGQHLAALAGVRAVSGGRADPAKFAGGSNGLSPGKQSGAGSAGWAGERGSFVFCAFALGESR